MMKTIPFFAPACVTCFSRMGSYDGRVSAVESIQGYRLLYLLVSRNEKGILKLGYVGDKSTLWVDSLDKVGVVSEAEFVAYFGCFAGLVVVSVGIRGEGK